MVIYGYYIQIGIGFWKMSILWRLCGSLMRIIGELYGKMLMIGGYDGG